MGEERTLEPQVQPNQDCESCCKLAAEERIQNQEGFREIINQGHPPRQEDTHHDFHSSSNEENSYFPNSQLMKIN